MTIRVYRLLCVIFLFKDSMQYFEQCRGLYITFYHFYANSLLFFREGDLYG